MKEKIMNAKPLYHKTLFIYTLLFAVYTLFGRVTLLHGLVEHTINSFVFILAGFFGLMLFGIDLLFYRDFIKMRYCLCRDIHRVECFLRCEKQPDNTDLAY